MAALISMIFWLHFYKVGGSGDALSILFMPVVTTVIATHHSVVAAG